MIVFQFSYKFFGLYSLLSLNPLTLMGDHDQDMIFLDNTKCSDPLDPDP